MADFDIVFTGNIVFADRVVENGWVAVSGEKVELTGTGAPPAARETHNAGQGWILPGAIDGQVHSGSQLNQEGLEQATRAAAAGGVTTICDMPFDASGLVSTPDRFSQKRREVETQAHVDVGLIAAMDPTQGPSSIPPLAALGACAFKFSTMEFHPERFPRTSTLQLFDAFREVASVGLVACVHNENQEIVTTMIERARERDPADPRIHAWTRPQLNEALAMLEIYELGVASGAHAHVVHCSMGRGVEICNAYKQQGHSSSVEVPFSYLFLSEEDDVVRVGAQAKINPPIRDRAEREKLWAHFLAGNIDMISTDHVAWSIDRKSNPRMLENSSGIPGLEIMIPLLMTASIERGFSPSFVARTTAHMPSRHFRFARDKGALEPGTDADVVMVQPAEYRYDPSSGHTCVDWSPYAGRTLKAKIAGTWRRGQLIFDGTRIISSPGSGRFVRPVTATR